MSVNNLEFGKTLVSEYRVCHVCEKIGTVEEIKMCSTCSRAYYCGVECQEKDYSTHKSVCRLACTCCGVQKDIFAKCSACMEVVYCDEKCQTKDWPSHRNNCKKQT